MIISRGLKGGGSLKLRYTTVQSFLIRQSFSIQWNTVFSNLLGKLNLVRKIGSSKHRTEANPWEKTFGRKNWGFREIEGSNNRDSTVIYTRSDSARPGTEEPWATDKVRKSFGASDHECLRASRSPHQNCTIDSSSHSSLISLSKLQNGDLASILS